MRAILLGLLAFPLLCDGANAQDVREVQLDNGLRVTLVEDQNAPRAGVWLHVGVGSADEGTGPRGLAHLAEHLFARGPASGERFLKRAERIGGEGVNAGTDFDATNFYWTVPPAALSSALALEAERLADPAAALTLRALGTERRIVLAEMREAAWALDARVKRAAFPLIHGAAHPHAVLPEGRETDVRRIGALVVRRWFDRWYRPANMRLVVVGPFDAARFEPTVRALFARVPARPGRAIPVAFPIASRAARAAPVTLEADVASMTLYGAAPGLRHPESAALERAAAALREAFVAAVGDRFGPSARATLGYRASARTGNVLLRIIFAGEMPPSDAEPFMRGWLRSALPRPADAPARPRSPLHPPPGTVLATAYELLVGDEDRAAAFGTVTTAETVGAYRRWFGPNMVAVTTRKANPPAPRKVVAIETPCWRIQIAADPNPRLARVVIAARAGPCSARERLERARQAILQRFREEKGWTYSVREDPVALKVDVVPELSFSVPAAKAGAAARITAELLPG